MSIKENNYVHSQQIMLREEGSHSEKVSLDHWCVVMQAGRQFYISFANSWSAYRSYIAEVYRMTIFKTIWSKHTLLHIGVLYISKLGCSYQAHSF